MKKILFRLMILAFTILLVGCEDDDTIRSVVVDGAKPVSSFTYTKNFLDVTFTNTSVDAESYYWDFGDDTFSTEKSPVHTYAASGNYNVVLKVNSPAGYSAKSEPETFYVAGQVKPFFTYTPGNGLIVDFDASSSVNAKSASWDFGDGSDPVDGFIVSHSFPANGTYTVKLTTIGLTDDEQTYTSEVVVDADFNLIKGGDMEASAAGFWLLAGGASNPAANPLTYNFGYTGDKPSGGNDACFIVNRYANGSAGPRIFIYQPIDVEEGKEYHLSAQVKLPAGAIGSALRFHIVRDNQINAANGEPEFNNSDRVYFEFNTWGKWGNDNNGAGPNINKSFAYDGDLTADIVAGLGRYSGGTNGIYTAVHTGKVYVGFSIYVSWSDSGGPWLIDDIRFEPVNP